MSKGLRSKDNSNGLAPITVMDAESKSSALRLQSCNDKENAKRVSPSGFSFLLCYLARCRSILRCLWVKFPLGASKWQPIESRCKTYRWSPFYMKHTRHASTKASATMPGFLLSRSVCVWDGIQ